MNKFRKRPVLVEAIQWTNTPNQFSQILEWSNHKVNSASPLVWENSEQKVDSLTLQVETLKGMALVQLNDYIIKGENGDFYTCNPDIFELTHEKID